MSNALTATGSISRRSPFLVWVLSIVVVIALQLKLLGGGQSALQEYRPDDSPGNFSMKFETTASLSRTTERMAKNPSRNSSLNRQQRLSLDPANTPDIRTPLNATKQSLHQNFTCPLHNSTWTFFNFPHFIIVGAQKAGTTAITSLLRNVTNVLGTRRPEAHFWDVVAPHRLEWTPDQKCLYRFKYLKKFRKARIRRNTIVFEKTPMLLAKPETAAVIRSMMEPYPPKIVIILRNPVDRFYSHWKMGWQNSGAKRPHHPSVEECVEEGVHKLRSRGMIQAPSIGNTSHWNASDFAVGTPKGVPDYASLDLSRGFYAGQVKGYMEHFPLGTSLKIIRYEDFMSNKNLVMNELLEFVGGSPHNFMDDRLEKQMGPLKVIKTWYPPMNNKTRAYLKHLYRPFNDELADLLGEDWRGVWD